MTVPPGGRLSSKDGVESFVPQKGLLPISEVFGPTIQGEGPFAGRVCSFLRFGGCNLGCWWCDSAYTWDGRNYDLREEIVMRSAEEVLDLVPMNPICVVTGGEPLLYQRRPAFMELMKALVRRGQAVHFETNGTVEPLAELVDLAEAFVVSPKLPHAQAQRGRTSPALHPGWGVIGRRESTYLKVVVESESDVAAAVRLADENHWDRGRVWVMPEGVDKDTLERKWRTVCEWATVRGVNASHRLHVLAWGEERGR